MLVLLGPAPTLTDAGCSLPFSFIPPMGGGMFPVCAVPVPVLGCVLALGRWSFDGAECVLT